MRALLLIDLQNDFLPGGSLAVPEGDRVLPVAQSLIQDRQRLFDYVVASQDWHPASHKSFASMHVGKNPGDVISLAGMQQVLWPDHCVQGTHGAKLAGFMGSVHLDAVFVKGTNPDVDSYSAFYDNVDRNRVASGDRLTREVLAGGTGLYEWLSSRDVDHLTVMGLATDYCVLFSVLDARQLGFKVLVLEDGCRAVNVHAGDGGRALQTMARAGAEIKTSVQLLDQDR